MRRLALGLALLASSGAPLAQVPPPDVPPAPGVGVARPSTAPRLPPPRPADDWLGRDKALHAGTSFALTLGGALALRAGMSAAQHDATALAFGTTLALGVTKEIADVRRPAAPLFSWRDLAADAVGAALGAVVASL